MGAPLPAGISLQILREGGSFEPAPDVLVTDMEDGQKVRRVGYGARERFTGQCRIPRALWAAFTAFVDNDLAGGVLNFDWVHPLTQAAVEAKFIAQDGRPYRLTRQSGGNYFIGVIIEVQ